jgi:hypothetical protein
MIPHSPTGWTTYFTNNAQLLTRPTWLSSSSPTESILCLDQIDSNLLSNLKPTPTTKLGPLIKAQPSVHLLSSTLPTTCLIVSGKVAVKLTVAQRSHRHQLLGTSIGATFTWRASLVKPFTVFWQVCTKSFDVMTYGLWVSSDYKRFIISITNVTWNRLQLCYASSEHGTQAFHFTRNAQESSSTNNQLLGFTVKLWSQSIKIHRHWNL